MKYIQTLEGISPDMLKGVFFVNWPNPPTPETHYKLLLNSYRVVLALDEKSQQVVGFINTISAPKKMICVFDRSLLSQVRMAVKYFIVNHLSYG